MARFTKSVFGLVLFVSTVGTAQGQQQVTFSDHIAKIIYAKCSSCHRPGQVGPFDLLTYDDIADRADTIKAVIDDGYMPPWKNMTNDVSFHHDRRLASFNMTKDHSNYPTKVQSRLINRIVEQSAACFFDRIRQEAGADAEAPIPRRRAIEGRFRKARTT